MDQPIFRGYVLAFHIRLVVKQKNWFTVKENRLLIICWPQITKKLFRIKFVL